MSFHSTINIKYNVYLLVLTFLTPDWTPMVTRKYTNLAQVKTNQDGETRSEYQHFVNTFTCFTWLITTRYCRARICVSSNSSCALRDVPRTTMTASSKLLTGMVKKKRTLLTLWVVDFCQNTDPLWISVNEFSYNKTDFFFSDVHVSQKWLNCLWRALDDLTLLRIIYNICYLIGANCM